MTAYADFKSRLMAIANAESDRIEATHGEEVTKVYRNALFDLEGPKYLNLPRSRDENFFHKAFRGFGEIEISYQTLLDAEVYIRRFPFGKTRITRVRYLRFHIEAYLQEVYILQERIIAYLKWLRRAYRYSPRANLVEAVAERLERIAIASLEPIRRARGAHVHEERFDSADLDRLGMLETIVQENSVEIYQRIYRVEHKKIRWAWTRWMRESNYAIGQLLEIVFSTLAQVVFDAQQELIYPNGKGS